MKLRFCLAMLTASALLLLALLPAGANGEAERPDDDEADGPLADLEEPSSSELEEELAAQQKWFVRWRRRRWRFRFFRG
ncbi:hypothetical protein BOX15_Mlig023933g1 [Macrostomum lignano]|uniref:Uncharacterized protein n=2 Tax=Macrostomum lignano TaxID=282301 RepID=A0A267DRN8_9PLAT|nr:hypothetical protein BOX15_Mlig023933g2 [Macrostomum lignano]PAA51826.1 hypothetical protein BOX15_Mlig023933g1 [Macrostomum lignano]